MNAEESASHKMRAWDLFKRPVTTGPLCIFKLVYVEDMTGFPPL